MKRRSRPFGKRVCAVENHRSGPPDATARAKRPHATRKRNSGNAAHRTNSRKRILNVALKERTIKQFEIIYAGQRSFQEQIRLARELYGQPHIALFHLFCDWWVTNEVSDICAIIRETYPGALVVGTSSHGNILDGEFTTGNIVITISLFELPTTKIEILSFPLESGEAVHAGKQMVKEVEARPWVKTVEALVMNGDEPLDDFCEAMSAMREDVKIFGGESHYAPSIKSPRFVIDNDGNVLDWGAVFVLYGGVDLSFFIWYVHGWKPLGGELTATSYTGNIVHELDGQPAHELYYRYLQIENDDRFYYNALDFPFAFSVDDETIVIRTPVYCQKDGSIVLASSVPAEGKMRIACGDIEGILDSVAECGHKMAAFRPDAIMAYSCAARRMFWSDAGSSRETRQFQDLAPTAGYYTAAELMRVNGRLYEHNATLVMAGVREGALDAKPPVQFSTPVERRKKSLVSRFARFIDAATEDLQDANRRLETLSRTDGLTGLLNRREIERLIREAWDAEMPEPCALIMMDLDDFKYINDTHGHREGDEALKHFASMAQRFCDEAACEANVGRWGGEEFIILMQDATRNDAHKLAEQLRTAFANDPRARVKRTVSAGVTGINLGEPADTALSRVDKALYQAKADGKNCVRVFD